MRPIRPEDVAGMSWHAISKAKAELDRECRAAADRTRAILLVRADPARILGQLPAEDPDVVAQRRRELAEAPVTLRPFASVGPGCAPTCTLPRRSPGSPWCHPHHQRWRLHGDPFLHVPISRRANSRGLTRKDAA